MTSRRGLKAALIAGAASLALAGVAAGAGVDDAATVSDAAVRSDTPVEIQPADPTARYRVTLLIEWSAATHPRTLPPNDHVSPPIAATHRDPGAMFSVGRLASPGIESMAERGGTSILRSELAAQSAIGDIEVASGRFGPGAITFEIVADRSNSRLSVVTMLAPSPDWFVGVDSLDLFRRSGWVPLVDQPLGAYDAGTDSGARFVSGDADTSPPLPVSGPRDAEFVNAAAEGPFGRLIVERIPAS